MGINWALPSNSGRDKLSGRFDDRWTTPKGRPVLLSEVMLCGDFWRSDLWGRGQHSSELARNFELRLPQLLLDETAVGELIAELEAWLIEPRQILEELAGNQGEAFSIAIGVDERSAITIEKPLCTIHCQTVVMTSLEVSFVTDQSCLRIFKEELENALARLRVN